MVKKLTKSRTDKKIFGVCGGFAKYFECDPVFVRLATVLLTLFWGTGLVMYIISAIIMPFDDEVNPDL